MSTPMFRTDREPGLGPWIALFAVLVAGGAGFRVVSTLAAAMRMQRFFPDQGVNLAVLLAWDALYTLLAFSAVFRLIRKRPEAIRFVKRFLLFTPVFFATLPVVAHFCFATEFSPVFSPAAPSMDDLRQTYSGKFITILWGVALFCMVWMCYFSMSPRVRTIWGQKDDTVKLPIPRPGTEDAAERPASPSSGEAPYPFGMDRGHRGNRPLHPPSAQARQTRSSSPAKGPSLPPDLRSM